MSSCIVFVAAVSSFLVHGCAAYSHGAPPSACKAMSPVHGVEPQTTPSPYSIFVTASTYHPDKPLKVLLLAVGTKRAAFSGFLLQARQVNSERICGSFLIPDPAANIQLRSCQGADDSVTHSKCFKDSSVDVTWYPPLHNYGLIKFHATIVYNKTTFWTNLESTSELKPDEDFMHNAVFVNGSYPHNHTSSFVWLEDYRMFNGGKSSNTWRHLLPSLGFMCLVYACL